MTLSQTLGKLDDSSSLPLYLQLQRALRQAIESRVLGPDDALPPERDLANDLHISRITVRKAIDGLISEGMLVRRQGSGTFVSARVEKNFSKLTSFSEDMRARGRTPRSVFLKKSAGSVTPEEALALRASPGTPVYRFHRIRFADEAPMSVEYTTVLASCLPALDAVESSLYEALERTGNRPTRALQRLFGDYVGVSPKWVIKRYRLHEAVEQLAGGRPPEWSALAQNLGYFDQAHFIRDFKRLVGRTPADYAAS